MLRFRWALNPIFEDPIVLCRCIVWISVDCNFDSVFDFGGARERHNDCWMKVDSVLAFMLCWTTFSL